jgi:orotate phosphoribosyltransferase
MKNFLKKLKKIGAIQKGEFILKSGKKNNVYYDLKKVYGEPLVFKEVVLEILKLIPKKTTCIAGSGNGGIPLATAVALSLGKKLSIVRDVLKDHGTKKEIDGHVPTQKDKVVIVDDVLSSGTSLRNTIEKLESKTEILKCVVILKKEEPKGIKYEIKSILEIDRL